MAASADQNESGASDTSAELGRLVAEMLLKSPLLAMNPTMVPHVAALAAATITGFSISMQMAGAFMGALQGATEVANRFTAEKDQETAPAEPKSPSPAAPTESANRSNGEASVSDVSPSIGAASIVKADAKAASAHGVKPKRAVRKNIEADDLKRISGIGPKLEQMLNGLGIRSAAQIAAWTDDEVQRIDAALGIDGRIVRDNWVGQAKRLAA